jgi:hypothetical protein
MEGHLLHSVMSKHIATKKHILLLDNHPDAVLKIFKTHNSTATYTINGPSTNNYDFAWINLDDLSIIENALNMLLNQFPNISIVAPPCNITVPNYYKFPLTQSLQLVTTLKAPIKRIQFIASVLQPYNFNLGSVKYGTGILHAFRVSNTKWKESSVIFAYIDNNNAQLFNCDNYYQNADNSYEDPRLFIWNNKAYVMYVHINPYQVGKYTKLLLKVDEINVDIANQQIKTIKSYTPPFNKNLEIGPEKNWAFWEGPSGQLLCQYTPGHLLEWTDLEHAPRELSNTPLPYSLRGGAPGVVYNDKVYCFCHSPNSMNLGLVVYTNTDNPTPTGIAKDIIKESDYDGVFFYVCGATITGKTWRLTGGMTDAACTIIELDADEIDSKIERLPFTS